MSRPYAFPVGPTRRADSSTSIPPPLPRSSTTSPSCSSASAVGLPQPSDASTASVGSPFVCASSYRSAVIGSHTSSGDAPQQLDFAPVEARDAAAPYFSRTADFRASASPVPIAFVNSAPRPMARRDASAVCAASPDGEQHDAAAAAVAGPADSRTGALQHEDVRGATRSSIATALSGQIPVNSVERRMAAGTAARSIVRNPYFAKYCSAVVVRRYTARSPRAAPHSTRSLTSASATPRP